MEWLAEAGYDPTYGARPLKRVIQRSLQDKLANLLLEGAVSDGATLQVTAGPDGLPAGAVAEPDVGRASPSMRSSPSRACTRP